MMQTEDAPFDVSRVRALLRAQVPVWADLPVRRLASPGTDNWVFRLGADLVLRLPRRASAVALLKKELDWLPALAGLPLEVPQLRFRGPLRPAALHADAPPGPAGPGHAGGQGPTFGPGFAAGSGPVFWPGFGSGSEAWAASGPPGGTGRAQGAGRLAAAGAEAGVAAGAEAGSPGAVPPVAAGPADGPADGPAERRDGEAQAGLPLAPGAGADPWAGAEFGVLDWIEGAPAEPLRIVNPLQAARALAAFLRALQAVPTEGAPRAGACNSQRGTELWRLDAVTRAAIDDLADEIAAPRALAMWEAACAVPRAGPPVWLHGDLKADNLVARDGRLCGVIDWGLAAVGDPAADHAAAWAWVDPAAREAFRAALGLTGADWTRARGWALYGAVVALSYYRGGRNEALCQQSRQTLSRLGLLL